MQNEDMYPIQVVSITVHLAIDPREYGESEVRVESVHERLFTGQYIVVCWFAELVPPLWLWSCWIG